MFETIKEMYFFALAIGSTAMVVILTYANGVLYGKVDKLTKENAILKEQIEQDNHTINRYLDLLESKLEITILDMKINKDIARKILRPHKEENP